VRLELPQYHTADESLRQVYAYLTRMVGKLNYALSILDVPDESSDAGIRAEDPNNKSIKLGKNSTNTQYPSAKAVVDYAVPKTREINGKSLENDVVLEAADVGAVPTSRKINGHTLDADVDLDAADVGAVPEDRTINGHALTVDVTLTPADLGEATYVTETGSSGDWTWRKWNTGETELWGRLIVPTLSAETPWGSSGFDYKTATVTLPAVFADANYTAHVQIARTAGGGSALLAATQNTDKTTFAVPVVYPGQYNINNIRFDIYVRGRAAEEA